MMTEDKAKEKWCPSAHNGADQPCIASKCMAWRWNEAKRTEAFVAACKERVRQKSKPDKPYNYNKAIQEIWAERGQEFIHTEGYCGLAGRPE